MHSYGQIVEKLSQRSLFFQCGIKEDEPPLIRTHSKEGAYSKGAAYWQEGAKLNHFGIRRRNAAPRNPADATLSAELSKISPSACTGYG